MNISELEVTGFGTWTGLKLDGLTPGVNVFYGVNETGKTTLLEFLRTMLYGLPADRRARYLPPVSGGDPGGQLRLDHGHDRFTVQRRLGSAGDDSLRLIAADGSPVGTQALVDVLSHVDEATYQNVFAIGLRELQELGTLSDTEASQLLYKLSAGIDRVALADVLRELENSRERILPADERTAELPELLAERDRLRGAVEELRNQSRQHARWSQEREQVEQEIARLEREIAALEVQSKHVESANSLLPRWRERQRLDDELRAAGPSRELPANLIERLTAVRRRIFRRTRRLKSIGQERKKLAEELRDLSVDQGIHRHAARIEALSDQQSWLTALDQQIRQLTDEAGELDRRCGQERQRLGLVGEAVAETKGCSVRRRVSTLRVAARELVRQRGRVREAQRLVEQSREAGAGLAAELKQALAGRSAADLRAAIEESGHLVSRLRRRLQLDERLARLSRHRSELEEQLDPLTDRQILPGSTLGGLGGLFVCGVALLLAGLLLPTLITGSLGWPLALLGLTGTLVAGGTKIFLERHAAGQLSACQRQLEMVDSQVKQGQEERDQLDRLLPRGSGPLSARLTEAEQELAKLEEWLPLDTRCRTTAQEAHEALDRLARTKRRGRRARRLWQEALTEAGLPTHLAPREARALATGQRQLADLRRRRDAVRNELDERRRALAGATERLRQLMLDLNLQPTEAEPAAQIHQLRSALNQQLNLAERRATMHRRTKELRLLGQRCRRDLSRWRGRRLTLLRQAGVDSLSRLKQLAADQARIDQIRTQRELVHTDLEQAIRAHATWEPIARLLTDSQGGNLERHWEDIARRSEQAQARLRTLVERRGELTTQLKAFAEDRRLTEARLALTAVEARLEQLVEKWQVLTVTHHTLDEVRRAYETERQPDTLIDASKYLERLTEGRYRRVWTPWGERNLRVDDSHGNTLDVDRLSSGAREQLFLSLRLALVRAYGRRGAQLPLVMDDLLVNFDHPRARAAVRLLCDFATEGNQLLVFTCHEHIARMFHEAGAPVRTLPGSPPLMLVEKEPELPRVAEPLRVEPLPNPIERRRRRVRPTPPPVVEPPRAQWVELPPVAGPPEADWEFLDYLAPRPAPRPRRERKRFVTQRVYDVWNGSGAEEFAGEFRERLIEPVEIRDVEWQSHLTTLPEEVAKFGTRGRRSNRSRQPIHDRNLSELSEATNSWERIVEPPFDLAAEFPTGISADQIVWHENLTSPPENEEPVTQRRRRYRRRGPIQRRTRRDVAENTSTWEQVVEPEVEIDVDRASSEAAEVDFEFFNDLAKDDRDSRVIEPADEQAPAANRRRRRTRRGGWKRSGWKSRRQNQEPDVSGGPRRLPRTDDGDDLEAA